tara:strand:+ start:111 stop:1028 length:918 start_codon:yes stop_codon:yes gene_type:complete
MATAFITHADCALHDMGAHHPECPQRLGAINDRLIASGLDAYLEFHDAPLATDAQILRAHSAAYLGELRAAVPERGIHHLDPDTAIGPRTLDAALRAAGAGVLATDLVVSGRADNAFCAVRPPGHHACRSRAMGFCLFNNIAIAALHALEAHGLGRVAVVDFDVHHGNGTEDILGEDARVMMASTFQHPFYPYSGDREAPEHWVNVPVRAGLRGEALREIVTAQWLPALRRFEPQMIFISAGFDAHLEDDMASCALVEADFAWVTGQLRALECANGRIVSMLEGGYALSALGRSAVEHVRALADL